jgi:hypothetical protein
MRVVQNDAAMPALRHGPDCRLRGERQRRARRKPGAAATRLIRVVFDTLAGMTLSQAHIADHAL